MNGLKKFATHCISLAIALPYLAVLLLLGGCASQPISDLTPPPLLDPSPPKQVADVDVLAVSAEMDEFLERYILKYKDRQTRLYLLMSSVTNSGVLGFDYDETLTLTAQESFRRRTGNCIGFANMMVALARRAGLQARYQEVIRSPEWFSREDTVLLIKHVNVIVESPIYTYVVDVSGIELGPTARQRLIDDSYAKALYLNNIGAEALLDNDLPTAHAYLSSAIATNPELTDPWVNMGVVFGRNGQLDDAVIAYNRVLELDSNDRSALNNLYEVYNEQGDLESAALIQARVDRYRQNNPYHMLQLSEEALAQDQFEESLKLLKKAIRKKDNDHILYFALARTQYMAGEFDAAEGSISKARELAPRSKVVYYDRPLDELIAEYALTQQQ